MVTAHMGISDDRGMAGVHALHVASLSLISATKNFSVQTNLSGRLRILFINIKQLASFILSCTGDVTCDRFEAAKVKQELMRGFLLSLTFR
jgi:hypothetical protein